MLRSQPTGLPWAEPRKLLSSTAPRHHCSGQAGLPAVPFRLTSFLPRHLPASLVAIILVPSSLGSISGVTHLTSCEPPGHPSETKQGRGQCSLEPESKGRLEYHLLCHNQPGQPGPRPSLTASVTLVLVTQEEGVGREKGDMEIDGFRGNNQSMT